MEKDNKKIRVAIDTLGCKLNQSESESLARQLSQSGFEIVESVSGADLYILNSCTVTHVADRKSRHMLRMARRINPSVKIFVTGCFADLERADILKSGIADSVFLNSEKDCIPDILEKEFQNKPFLPLVPAHLRTRSSIKVQEGCCGACTYCIVPRVRGHERSRSPGQILAEIRQRRGEAVKEIVLTGTEIGRYSYEGMDFQMLLNHVLNETDMPRIRISSLQPGEINNNLLDLWKDRRLCRHFHISLQSGSDSVLARMKRRYNTALYSKCIEDIRSALPQVSITTDIIVGFPGETCQEFEQSKDFCKKMSFSRIHVFQYSPRNGTEAAAMPGQVTPEVKKQRSNIMLDLAECSLKSYNRSLLDSVQHVLFEQTEKLFWTGLTDNYVKVYCCSREDLSNRLCAVKLEDLHADGMLGIIQKE